MNRKLNLIAMTIALAGTILGQTVVPDGTPVKLRLNEPLSSGRNRVGQGVSLSVAEDVMIGDRVVIEAGSRATGTVTVADPKRRMGRGGKLDFIPVKLQLPDGRMVSLRATQQGSHGKGNGVATGMVAAGIAIVFLPAAPLALLIKGKDVEIPAGMTFTSFTDIKFTLKEPATENSPATKTNKPEGELRNASLAISCDTEGADIEIDGSFVGQAPATFSLTAGEHRVVVHHDGQVWERSLRMSPGNNVNLKVQLPSADTTKQRLHGARYFSELLDQLEEVPNR